jgi:hypothetical protein
LALKNLLFHKPYINSSFKGNKGLPKKAEIRRFWAIRGVLFNPENSQFCELRFVPKQEIYKNSSGNTY